ncbi:MAG: UvrB/UvrC motif-containing protein [Gemmataceae bacterium]
MKCQFCGADATVHLTDIVQKKKRETHLCEECAKKHNILPTGPGPQLNLQALLELILGQPAPLKEPTDDPNSLVCSTCGTTYPQFRNEGRFGCAEDYDVFRTAIEPIMEKVHRGLTHVGKIPRSIRREQQAQQLSQLREELRQAVEHERYEEAARLRDEIRQKEVAE